jgi:uncharacterized protein YidB (DUF937 family)
MGLLDDLIGQLAAGSAPRPGAPAPQASSGPGMSTVLVALAPVVIAMLSNRGAQGGAAAPSGGGLGDVLGQVLGGGRGGAPATGGLGGLLEQFQRAGFGDQTRTWVGRGQNALLPPEVVEQTFGRSGVAEIARRAGVSEADATRGLSQLLPEVVDRVTPGGEVPDDAALLANVGDLARRLGLG